MKMLYFLAFTASLFTLKAQALADDCQLYTATRGDLVQIKETNEDLRSLSRSVNEALKSSYELLNKVDHATYGLASAYLLNGVNLDLIEPNEWNKARFVGALVYQDQPFSLTSLKGVEVKITDQKKKTWTLTTGSQGEFSMHFYELVPYQRIRLFPGLIIDHGKKFKKTIKVPITIEVNSSFCKSKITLEELPIEPVTLIATSKKESTSL